MGALQNRAGGVWPIADRLNIGIVGLGTMGRVYLDCFERMENASVVAAVSRSANSSAEDKGIKVYDSIGQVLDHEDLDALCLCTPTYLHASQARETLMRNVNVICEKPLALTKAEAEELYDIGAEKGAHIYPAHVVRFSAGCIWLREAVRSGRFGAIRDAFFSRLSTAPAWCNNHWAYDKALSGLVPFDLHIHDLDLIVSLFGMPKTAELRGAGSRIMPFDEHIWFRYDYDAFSVTAEASWYKGAIPFEASWRICFENALAVCHRDKVTVYEHDKPSYDVLPQETAAHATGFSVPATDMYDRELAYFASCIIENKAPDMIPEKEVTEVIGLLERMTNTESL